MAYTVTPLAGVDFDVATSAPSHALGTIVVDSQGKFWVYGVASGTIAAGAGSITVSTTASWVATSGSVSRLKCSATFVDGQYGWFQSATVLVSLS